MKNHHQIWYIIRLQSILRLSSTTRRSPLVLPGKSSRFLTGNRRENNNSKEALLGDAAKEASGRVPKGHLAVYVGPELRRFVIPARCLGMPEFRVLMDSAAEEFGFDHQGGIQIPCEEDRFREILGRCLEMKSKRKRM